MATASLISRLSQAVDQIEKRLKKNRPLKVITVRLRRGEDSDAAKDRHVAAHPEDRDADVVILIREMSDESVAAPRWGQHARN
jgi:hypothetical protein